MGLSYIYKKFTAQDKAIVPFNAHKQYNFSSGSAASNQITVTNTSYTSESISLYSSASSIYGGDLRNVIKYNQLDHLFYRDYTKKAALKKDFISFLENRRELYEKNQIISIPSGLYGYEIKKSSFYLSASGYEIVDDSKGNLIISGTNIDNYPNDVQQNVFRLDPIKGFKKYDLNVYDDYVVVEGGAYQDTHEIVTKKFYRQGSKIPGAIGTYTTPGQIGMEETTQYPRSYYTQDEDDSYFFNKLNYNNVRFETSSLGNVQHQFPSIVFNSSTGSYIMVPNKRRFNFNTTEDFAVSFYIHPQATGSDGDMSNLEKRYIIAKSGEKHITPILNAGISTTQSLAGPQYPFEIYMRSQSLYFSRSDGKTTDSIFGEITSSHTAQRKSHILCQLSSSVMELWFNGTKIANKTITTKGPTKNDANLYIGSKGTISTSADDSGLNMRPYFFNGKLNNINIWSKSYNSDQITNISESVNASPYVGNIFYQSGLATITHPNHYRILDTNGIGNMTIAGYGIGNMTIGTQGIPGFTVNHTNLPGGFIVGKNNNINTIQFQGSHLIYEHEYQCDIQEYEFNSTTNISARNTTGTNPHELAGFTTSSHFQPYITTIGLYNENHELLVVGKLGQPIRKSEKTDMTFVLRWDT